MKFLTYKSKMYENYSTKSGGEKQKCIIASFLYYTESGALSFETRLQQVKKKYNIKLKATSKIINKPPMLLKQIYEKYSTYPKQRRKKEKEKENICTKKSKIIYSILAISIID